MLLTVKRRIQVHSLALCWKISLALCCGLLFTRRIGPNSFLHVDPVLSHGSAPPHSAWTQRTITANGFNFVEDSVDLAGAGGAEPAHGKPRKMLRILRGLLSPEKTKELLDIIGTLPFLTRDGEGMPGDTLREQVMSDGRWHGSQRLVAILQPFVEEVVVPYMRNVLGCPSLSAFEVFLRAYVPGKSRSNAHFDHFAMATALLDLSLQPGSGLYVGRGADVRSQFFVPFTSAGDVAVHKWDVLHGVQLRRGQRRVSLIIWTNPRKDVEHGTTSWCESEARDGNPDAFYRLGSRAKLRKQLSTARESFERAAQAGHPFAMHALSETFMETGDSIAARSWLLRAASAGLSDAQMELAEALAADGDSGGSISQLELAAMQGNKRSLRVLRSGADSGNVAMMFMLSRALREIGQDPEGKRWLAEAAGAGVSAAQVELAELLGNEGDISNALLFWEAAARQGNEKAVQFIQMFKNCPVEPSGPSPRKD